MFVGRITGWVVVGPRVVGTAVGPGENLSFATGQNQKKTKKKQKKLETFNHAETRRRRE